MFNYIFISGTVGAGKSTVIDQIQNYYANNSSIIKEYIDWDEEGENRLNQFLGGETSEFDFQRYVVDCFFKQIIEIDAQNKTEGFILICERHPLESLLFASQKLTFDEMLCLYEYIINMCGLLNVPLPSDCGFVRVNGNNGVDGNSPGFMRIVDAYQNYHSLLAHIDINEKTQGIRMFKRGRKSDLLYLSECGMDYIRKINLCYRALPMIHYDIRPETFCVFYRQDDSVALPAVDKKSNLK